MPRKMKNKAAAPTGEPPAKRTKLLSDDEDSDVEISNGVALAGGDSLKINEDFAKRFEHNEKRKERERLEEKFKNGTDDEEDESTSEEEDDVADLVTADLDAEIFATLNAIKKKDPRVYDKSSTFYTPFNPEDAPKDTVKKEKPMYLADYQRKQLLEGNHEDDSEDDAPPRTYAQEQEDLKASLVNQMHAADAAHDSDADQDGFLVKKDKGAHADMPAAQTSTTTRSSNPGKFDVDGAAKDPETYLSNFMAARAWIPNEVSRFQAFDSDDSEDDHRADQFEHAYNLRFEDPNASKEKLMTYGRDVAKYSVRRDDTSGRKKVREREREKKEAQKKEREADRARYRKLKIEEVEEKVKKIKEAAGLHGEALDVAEWSKVLEEDFDDDQWEAEMQKRFGDGYYAQKDERFGNGDSEDEPAELKNKRSKPKKPKWDDDIDIKDLVPEFKEDNEETAKPNFTLSDDDNDDEEEIAPGAAPAAPLATTEAADISDNDDAMDIDIIESSTGRKTKKDRLKARADAKRATRKERLAIEELVDADLSNSLLPGSKEKSSGFRYRETSPDAFGLTPRDILFADDSQLNQFAGLKKMAAFRDAEKKRRDKKKLGKKARLRQWRKDTFGDEEGFVGGFKDFLGERTGGDEPPMRRMANANGEGQGEGGSRKRRGKKRKTVGGD